MRTGNIENASFGRLQVKTSDRAKTGLIVGLVLLLAFTVIHTVDIGGLAEAGAFFVPGLVGIAALLAIGFSRSQCLLTARLPSKKGLLALAAFTPFLIPLAMYGKWSGWDLQPVMLLAPASGIAQELYFRGVLLPVLLRIFPGRRFLAIGVHAVLFALWHMPLVILINPAGVAPIFTVTFIGGLVWGYQAQKDGTLLWTTIQHTLFLVVMSLFGLK